MSTEPYSTVVETNPLTSIAFPLARNSRVSLDELTTVEVDPGARLPAPGFSPSGDGAA